MSTATSVRLQINERLNRHNLRAFDNGLELVSRLLRSTHDHARASGVPSLLSPRASNGQTPCSQASDLTSGSERHPKQFVLVRSRTLTQISGGGTAGVQNRAATPSGACEVAPPRTRRLEDSYDSEAAQWMRSKSQEPIIRGKP